jgi:prevent-host-death family protein
MGIPKLSEDLLPLSEMKTRPGEVIGQLQRTGRPVFLTRYGKGVAVVMSLESFEAMQAAAAQAALIGALREAEEAIAAGDVVEHGEVDALLEQWNADAS